jgi:hypothetical protein
MRTYRLRDKRTGLESSLLVRNHISAKGAFSRTNSQKLLGLRGAEVGPRSAAGSLIRGDRCQ